MTRDEAIAFVRGMVRDVRPLPRDDAQKDWIRKAGFEVVLDSIPAGVPSDAIDAMELDWRLEGGDLAALADSAKADGAAYDAAVFIVIKHLQRQRPVPEPLVAFTVGLLDGSTNKPRRETAKYFTQVRDEMAAAAIDYLVRRGFKVQSVNELSASAVVFAAMKDAGYPVTDAKTIATRYSRQKALQNSPAS